MINYLLINTPLTDPTAPYHSIPYLVGATHEAGFTEYSCLDANIEALNYMAQPEQVSTLLAFAQDIRETIERAAPRTRRDQLRYGHSLKAVGLQPESVAEAIATLKSPDTFFDYHLNRRASMILNRWMDILSLEGIPGQFDGFYLSTQCAMNLSRVADLTNELALHRIVCPFAPYFDGPFRQSIEGRTWDLIGLSVNYISQLPFAIWMCKRIKALLPGCFLCVGGTEISDVFKYLRDKRLLWKLFPECDAAVVGEGETALTVILQALLEKRPLPSRHPGILSRRSLAMAAGPSVYYEDLRALPRPRYEVWNWQQYWSPEPVALYSPTRGCYWNKCTFCDYGLNSDSPTSPSRERPVEVAIAEIQQIARFAKTIYFAVDAISPAYLRKLTRAIREHKIEIRWGAELRLERSLRKELGRELKESGCICISFGYESGSQRILDLIDKGVALKQVGGILRQLSDVGIGVEMMGFIGFPGETEDEACETFEFLKRHREHWTLYGIGDFEVTSGAIVAKRPEAFGIKSTHPYRGEDIERFLYWVGHDDERHGSGDLRTARVESLARTVDAPLGSRPFLGGMDSTHTLLYFGRYGACLLPPDARNTSSESVPATSASYGSPFSGIDRFVSKEDLADLHSNAKAQGNSIGHAEVEQWLSEPSPAEIARGGESAIIEVFTSGIFIESPSGAVDQKFSPAFYAIRQKLLQSYGVT